MTNPFDMTPMNALSNAALERSVAEYNRMLMALCRYTDSSQVRDLRSKVRSALTDLLNEARRRRGQVRLSEVRQTGRPDVFRP